MRCEDDEQRSGARRKARGATRMSRGARREAHVARRRMSQRASQDAPNKNYTIKHNTLIVNKRQTIRFVLLYCYALYAAH